MRRESVRRTSIGAVLSVVLAVPLSLLGQTTGRIEGHVRDGRIGNVTNEDGYFFIPRVPVGLHDITARSPGYVSITVIDQRVFAGQIHYVDFAIPSMIIELRKRAVADALETPGIGSPDEYVDPSHRRFRREPGKLGHPPARSDRL